MNLELRNISVNQALSEETNCYSAKLFKDGVFIADVGNHGHGGPDHQHPAPGKRTVLDEIEAYFKALPKIVSKTFTTGPDNTPFEMEQDLELWCGEQIDNYIAAKQYRRAIKTKVLYVTPRDTNGVYETGWKGLRALTSQHVEAVAVKHPEAVILNRLPEDVAVYVFRAMSGGDPQWADA